MIGITDFIFPENIFQEKERKTSIQIVPTYDHVIVFVLCISISDDLCKRIWSQDLICCHVDTMLASL